MNLNLLKILMSVCRAWRPLVHSTGEPRKTTLTLVGRALIAAITLLCTGLHLPAHVACQLNSLEEQDDSVLDNAIILGKRSHASLRRRSAGTVLVHVWKGIALIKYPDTASTSVIVTAGGVQLSHIEAVVCMEVQKERTIVEVLSGTTTFTQLHTGTLGYSVAELTLHAGDRLELRNVSSDAELRYELGGKVSGNECERGRGF